MTSFDCYELDKMIDFLIKNSPSKLAQAVKLTTAEGLHLIKTEYTLGRSGEARKSFLSQKISDFVYKIYSNLTQVKVLEVGAKAHTVFPKRKKFLSIPIDKNLLVKNGYRFKKMTPKEYWEAVKTGGIIRARKARIPAMAAKEPLKKTFQPAINKRMLDNVKSAYRSMLNG
jgi:hypothetical protein